MNLFFRRILAGCLSVQISLLGMTVEGCASRQVTAAPGPSEFATAAEPIQPSALRGLLQKPYVELFELAPSQEFTAAEIEAQRKALQKGKDFCVGRFKEHSKQYAKQIDTAQKDLKVQTVSMNDGQRKQVHCRIQNLELLRSEAQALANHAIPTAYDNLNAKLDLIQNWPALYKQTQQEIAKGTYMNRRWADVKDIGFREIAANQQDDIKKGQQAIEEMKRSGLLPPEVEDKAIQEYVNSVAQRIAQKSDLGSFTSRRATPNIVQRIPRQIAKPRQRLSTLFSGS